MRPVILAGCGGGCDIYGAMPLYYQFKDSAPEIIIVNLSFAHPGILREQICAEEVVDGCFKINQGSQFDDRDYLPECLLANKLNHTVYAICNYDTVQSILNSYLAITRDLNEYDFYLVDGGCDVLLSGNETALATYVEDMMHLKAVLQLQRAQNIYVCAIGLNVDCGHGVLEHELIKRLEDLQDNGTLISSELLKLSDDKTKFYYDIVLDCNPSLSCVQSFVCAALEGQTGFIVPEAVKSRISQNNSVNVSDLTRTLIICNGRKLAENINYLDRITNQMSSEEVDNFFD